MRPERSIAQAITTEEGVYGLILVSGLVAASGSSGSPVWRTLAFTGVAVIVFWIAHVYAGAMAAHGTPGADGRPTPMRASIAAATRRSRGLLAATLPAAIPLLLGAIGVLSGPTATWISLWVCVGVLAMIGYVAYSRRGAKWWVRILGSMSTASFGIAVILAKAFVTH